ncbi:MAG: nicotinate (nicotinamide) nucleotide adenylyltransferase [Rhodoferax sp.]
MRRAAALRIGIFGGAFDPPHLGHRALALAALEQLGLDRLLVIPTGQAWHKAGSLSPAAHRLEMARLAFADLERVHIDARETQRAGPTYTIDTLHALQREQDQAQWFLLVGQDQAQALHSWRNWQEICRIAIICVAERPDLTGDFPTLDLASGALGEVRRLQMPPHAISASEIRRRVAHHESIAALVFEPVARYIDHHHLYQPA